MSARILLSLACGLILTLALSADDGKVDQLIRQLGSDQFVEREGATQELEKIGLPALEALKKAATQHPDIEARRRAMELVARLEKRLESSRLLAPTKVSFDYQDTPLADAVADLAKRSGQPIVLGIEPAKLAGRKVTARIDPTDFWPALDHFLAKANLIEATSIPVGLGNNPGEVPVRSNPLRRLNTLTDQIVLVDGARQETPTHHQGAARIRALPAETAFAKDQVGFILGVTLEAGMPISKIVGVRIDKAIDEQGQALEQIAGDATVGNPAFIGNFRGQAQGVVTTSGQHQAPVRFKAPAADGKQLRELTGTLAVEMRARPEVLMTVDNIMKAAGQTAKAKTSGSLTVQDVEKQDDGLIRIRLELQPPPEANPNNAGAVPVLIQQVQVIQIGAAGRVQPIDSSGDLGLTLLDDKNQRFDLISIPSRRTRIDQAGVHHECTLLFRPREGQTAPARLTYSNSRLAIVEIPFRLAYVPLR